MPLHPTKNTVLFVDGYNMIGLWPHLQARHESDGLEAARLALTEDLVNYSAFQGYETRLIFDSQYQQTRGYTDIITENVSVFYTDFGQTADTYIEKSCAGLRDEVRILKWRVIVATSDRIQQLMVAGYGAELMSAQQLVNDIELTARRRQNRHRTNKQSSGRFLASCLDPESQRRLAQMRMGLPG